MKGIEVTELGAFVAAGVAVLAVFGIPIAPDQAVQITAGLGVMLLVAGRVYARFKGKAVA